MAFRLFNHIDQFEALADLTATVDFYRVLIQLQTAAQAATAQAQDNAWAAYPTFVDYARICFWAIRNYEYSFIAEAFADLEAQADHQLRVLDVGCGVVPLCNWMSQRGHQVVAFDSLQPDIEFLVKNDLNALYHSTVAYYLGRGEQLPFADATFDVVTFVSVLEHITPGNDLLALWEIARVLKPSGTLLITFDVAPAPVDSPDSDAAGDQRAFAQPFTAESAARFWTQLSKVFAVSAADIPADLARLSWEEVYGLWRAVQQHDHRDETVRNYLAMGGVLKRRAHFTPLDPDQVILAYLRGESVLAKRMAFFERHAHERLKQLGELSAANEAFRQAYEAQAAALAAPPSRKTMSFLKKLLGIIKS